MPTHQTYLSPELANPLAAIDVGTNSIRLIIAEGLRGGKYRILDDEKDTSRLGANLSQTGRLDPQAVQRLLEALRRMKQIADGYQVRQLRAIATSAVREASDGADFCRRANDEVGLKLEVVSSKQEARLAYLSVARNFDLAGSNVAVADIGGGSTEIVMASNNVVEEIYSTTLGGVRLTELHDTSNTADGENFEQLVTAIDRTLRKRVGKPPFVPQLLIGTGGTFTSLATMIMAAKGQTGLPVRGYQISRAEVRHLLDQLRKISLKARRGVPGLGPDRADIIVAGLTVIDRLLRHLGVNRLQVHNGGVRDGLLLTMVDHCFSLPGIETTASSPDRETAVNQFAASCSVDMRHGDQVARLAGSIYEQLAGPLGMPPEDRLLLETAARLQDVGYMINYEDHHKHSYHLILNSDLPFRPQDLQIIANIARYHRGSEPKRKHSNFEKLAPDDQLRIRRLTSVLRVAGGLDRSHTQQVQGLTVKTDPASVSLLVSSLQNPEVDLWGARRRTEMFERVFKLPLTVEWQSPPQAAAPGTEAGTA